MVLIQDYDPNVSCVDADEFRFCQAKQTLPSLYPCDGLLLICVHPPALPKSFAAKEAFWETFLHTNKLGERVLAAYAQKGDMGSSLMLGSR